MMQGRDLLDGILGLIDAIITRPHVEAHHARQAPLRQQKPLLLAYCHSGSHHPWHEENTFKQMLGVVSLL